jgi:hypothetical protein
MTAERVPFSARDITEVDQVEGYGVSQPLLDRLINQGTEDRELLLMIARCAHQEELFTQLVGRRRGAKCWWRFVETVLTLPDEMWSKANGDLNEDLVQQLVSIDVLARIVKPKTPAHRAIYAAITTSYHPLFAIFDFTPYWQSQAEHFTENGDYKRAWDEIRAAHRGFFIRDHEPNVEEERDLNTFRSDPKHRCCQASVPVLKVCVQRLFDAMVESGVISALSPGDTIAPRDTDREMQPQWRGSRRVTVPVFVQHRYPNKSLILAMGGTYTVSTHGGYVIRGPVRNPRSVIKHFHELSAKAYKISRYFLEKKKNMGRMQPTTR